MSTTWITTIKVAGPCCSDLTERVDKWHEAVRQGTDAIQNVTALRSPMADATEIEVRRLLSSLEAHATRPPVVFFDRHLDGRTMGHEFLLNAELPMTHLMRIVTCNDLTVLFLSLAMEEGACEGLSKSLAEKAAHAQFEETRMLFTTFRQCLASWNALLQPHKIPSALLLFFDRVGGSWMDREVVSGCSAMPEWLPKVPWSGDPTGLH